MVVLTDGEKDDWASMVRFLLYTSDFDVDGVIQVNSRWQPNGHSNEHWYETEIDKYEEVYPNLIKHNANYPTPERLRSIMRVGNENKADLAATPSRMKTTNTPANSLSCNCCLTMTRGPFNSSAGAEYQKAVAKVRLYGIWYQDNGGRWIQHNVPQAKVFESYNWEFVWDYKSVGTSREGVSRNPADVQEYMNSA